MTVQVEVWHLSLARASLELAERLSSLSQDERAKAERFTRDEDRASYVAVRSSLRSLLASRLGCSAAEVRFAYGDAGKPTLIDDPTLRFSVSHSGHRALVAVTEGRDVGVDIEAWTETPSAEVLNASLAPEERTRVQSASDPRAAFYDHWTRKEAVLKARGSGLGHSIRNFVTAPDQDEWLDGYYVRQLAVDGGYSGAFAVHSPHQEGIPRVVMRGLHALPNAYIKARGLR